MFRIIMLFLMTVMVVLPAMADAPLNQAEADSLPFDHSIANTFEATLIDAETMGSKETPHEKKAGLPQFDVTTFASQLFWLAIAFGALYLFFAKKALPALSETIDMRKLTIKNDITAANKLSKDVDRLQTDYEKAMTKAHNEARTTAMAIENDLRLESERESQIFREKSMKAITDLESRAEQAKEAIRSELETVASEIAADIISKLGHMTVADGDIRKAVQRQLEASSKQTSREKKAA